MKKVLVLGSSGAMGQYLVPFLSQMGYAVDAVSLDEENLSYKNVKAIKANVFENGVLDELLKNRYDGVVDFMNYGGDSFYHVYKKFLNNTDHYIFLSSCRIYANEETPIKETSPRLLDVTADPALRASDDYCIYKAKSENLLMLSGYKNWTIVRPATTYSKMRYQLVTLEAPFNVGRAFSGKKVVLPIQAKDKPATLSWAGDVAEMIAKLLFNPCAICEIYNVSTSESRKWSEIADYYKDICGLESVWVDKEDYMNILKPGIPNNVRWQLEYARLFDRITDNTKALEATGMKQENMMPLYDGLKREIAFCPRDHKWWGEDVNARMDEYIMNNKL